MRAVWHTNLTRTLRDEEGGGFGLLVPLIVYKNYGTVWKNGKSSSLAKVTWLMGEYLEVAFGKRTEIQ